MSNFNLHFSTVGMKAKNIYITISLSLAVSAGLHAEHWTYRLSLHSLGQYIGLL